MLRVVLDAKCEGTDVEAITSAVARLRGISHVERFADYDLEAPVEILALSTRPQNALIGARITTLRELTTRSRRELTCVKNLGKRGLREIEECLKLLGLQLQPQDAQRNQNEDLAKKLEELVTTFNEVRPALRRLWRAVEARGYVAQDWQDWRTVDEALRQYARRAAEHAGIDQWEVAKHIAAGDREPFLRSNVSADLGEDRLSATHLATWRAPR